MNLSKKGEFYFHDDFYCEELLIEDEKGVVEKIEQLFNFILENFSD